MILWNRIIQINNKLFSRIDLVNNNLLTRIVVSQFTKLLSRFFPVKNQFLSNKLTVTILLNNVKLVSFMKPNQTSSYWLCNSTKGLNGTTCIAKIRGSVHLVHGMENYIRKILDCLTYLNLRLTTLSKWSKSFQCFPFCISQVPMCSKLHYKDPWQLIRRVVL